MNRRVHRGPRLRSCGPAWGEALLLGGVLSLAGCDHGVAIPGPQGNNPAAAAPRTSVGEPQTSEEEARKVLKTTLDSWVFGDTVDEFRKAHPEILFGDLTRAIKTLKRYEITATRPSKAGIEFAVTLAFPGNPVADVTKNVKFTVWRKDDGKWMVLTAE